MSTPYHSKYYACELTRRWASDNAEKLSHSLNNATIDHKDPGGITEAVGWKGGGGFRYYRLAPSLLEKDEFPNLTVKKIPKAVLSRCEWSHDDYSLEIKNLPMKPEEEKAAPPAGPKPRSKSERRDQALLFDLSGAEGGAR